MVFFPVEEGDSSFFLLDFYSWAEELCWNIVINIKITKKRSSSLKICYILMCRIITTQ